MKTSKRFDRAISALVKGYMNDTLAKGNCSACAVGNIIAECLNIKIIEGLFGLVWENDEYKFMWADVFVTSGGKQTINREYYEGKAKEEIDSTGYTLEELALIEKTFEANTFINGNEYYQVVDKKLIYEDQYRGLMAVIEVLCEIEGYDQEVITKSKAVFERV